jgi:hypothetical protein
MAVRKGNLVIAALMLAAMCNVANGAVGDVFEFPIDSGHFYEVVPAAGITWDAARAAARMQFHNGIQGDLATINSQAELDFVTDLRFLTGLPTPTGNRKLAWLGGFQVVPCTPPASEPDCGWKWINNEAIAPDDTDDPFTRWLPGEPNNTGNAKHLAIGDNVTGVSDGNKNEIFAYIVEYGETLAPFAAPKCGAGGNGCNLTDGGSDGGPNGENLKGTLYEFPDSVTPEVLDGLEVTVTKWLVTDTRFDPESPLKCGVDALPFGPLTIPAVLCARLFPHQFVVLKIESSVPVYTGVVTFISDPTKYGLPSWGCDAQIPSGVAATDQDTAVYAYTDASQMLEGLFPVLNPLLNGNVAEVLNQCGTVRNLGGKGSWSLVGLSYEPGEAGSHSRMLELAVYKANFLLIAVDQARAEGAIDQGTHASLKGQMTNINNDLTNGNFLEALAHVDNFRRIVAGADIKTELDDPQHITRNWYGEFVFRNENLADVLSRRLPAE